MKGQERRRFRVNKSVDQTKLFKSNNAGRFYLGIPGPYTVSKVVMVNKEEDEDKKNGEKIKYKSQAHLDSQWVEGSSRQQTLPIGSVPIRGEKR